MMRVFSLNVLRLTSSINAPISSFCGSGCITASRYTLFSMSYSGVICSWLYPFGAPEWTTKLSDFGLRGIETAVPSTARSRNPWKVSLSTHSSLNPMKISRNTLAGICALCVALGRRLTRHTLPYGVLWQENRPLLQIIIWMVSLIESILFRRDFSFLYASDTRLITSPSFSFMQIIVYSFPLVFQPPDEKRTPKTSPRLGISLTFMFATIMYFYFWLPTSYTFYFYIFKLLTTNLTCPSKMSDFSLLCKPFVTVVTISIVYKILF